MKPIIRSSFAGAALALGLAAAPFAAAGALLLAPGVAQARSAPTVEEMKRTLADYGQFVTIEKYGEVWKPTVTPKGWHPYPACDWVYTKAYGWYFSDKTVWGSIVHHYGRWLHDETEGWLWVPGAEFSPGWVVWRTSDEWVGWAPTPPDVDMTPEKMAAFDDDKLWTFMDAKKFGSTCEPGVRTVANYGDAWKRTTYVTDVRFVDGISVFVLPPAIVGPVIDVDIDVFAPWSPTFIGSWVWNWTSVFNDIDINVYQCKTPKDPKNPKDPQEPKDPKYPDGQQPGPDNPKPFRPSLKDNAPPPAPGLNRRPRPQDIDTPNREWRKPKREVRSFEPQPDDVVVGRRPKREVREFEPQPDDVVVERRPGRRVPNGQGSNERKPREIDPDFIRRPNREAGERRPPVKMHPDGRFPQREAGERQPNLKLNHARTFEAERVMTPRRSRGGEGQGGGFRESRGAGRSFDGFRD